jgi:hypothetical protein
MSELRKYFNENLNRNSIDKWDHYFEIYEFWFNKYKNRPIVLLEIGIFQGGSLNMWREYFGDQAKIYAIDINPLCKQFETDNTKIFIGSQSDREFLKHVKSQIPKVDILIDDGGHMMDQQKITFEELYGHVKIDGLYLCEDLHTSYWDAYDGGYKKAGSFIEYSKDFIDKLNAWHLNDTKIKVDQFTRTTYSLHYYDSILLIEKKEINEPFSYRKGKIVVPIASFPAPRKKGFHLHPLKLLKKVLKPFRRGLRFLFKQFKHS